MSKSSKPDPYADVRVDTDDPDLMERLRGLAKDLFDSDLEIERLEKELEDAKAERTRIAEVEMAGIMDRLEMEEFTAAGMKYKVGDVLHASLTKAKKPRALAWLDENGAAGLVRRSVVVPFVKGQDDEATKLVKRLQKTYPDVTQHRDAHTGTVKAWIKERIAAGDPVPMDLFSAHIKRTVTIKPVKK